MHFYPLWHRSPEKMTNRCMNSWRSSAAEKAEMLFFFQQKPAAPTPAAALVHFSKTRAARSPLVWLPSSSPLFGKCRRLTTALAGGREGEGEAAVCITRQLLQLLVGDGYA